MSDVRLKSVPFELEGKTYQLRCNFNVLADVTEEHGGELPDPFDKATQLAVCRSFLAAMVNDYADEMGWTERYSPKALGRMMGADVAVLLRTVMTLVVESMFIPAKASEDSEKKVETRQSR